MNIGMLWFDNDSKTTLEAKVGRAVSYYQGKYGKAPTLCFVHPSMLQANVNAVAGLEVRTTRSVMPNHFWIGVK